MLRHNKKKKSGYALEYGKFVGYQQVRDIDTNYPSRKIILADKNLPAETIAYLRQSCI